MCVRACVRVSDQTVADELRWVTWMFGGVGSPGSTAVHWVRVGLASLLFLASLPKGSLCTEDCDRRQTRRSQNRCFSSGSRYETNPCHLSGRVVIWWRSEIPGLVTQWDCVHMRTLLWSCSQQSRADWQLTGFFIFWINLSVFNIPLI